MPPKTKLKKSKVLKALKVRDLIAYFYIAEMLDKSVMKIVEDLKLTDYIEVRYDKGLDYYYIINIENYYGVTIDYKNAKVRPFMSGLYYGDYYRSQEDIQFDTNTPLEEVFEKAIEKDELNKELYDMIKTVCQALAAEAVSM